MHITEDNSVAIFPSKPKVYMHQNFKLLHKYDCTCMHAYTHKYVSIGFSLLTDLLYFMEKITQGISTLAGVRQ